MGAIDDELNRLSRAAAEQARRSRRPPGNYRVLVPAPPPQDLVEVLSDFFRRLPPSAFDIPGFKIVDGSRTELFLPADKPPPIPLIRVIINTNLSDDRKRHRKARQEWDVAAAWMRAQGSQLATLRFTFGDSDTYSHLWLASDGTYWGSDYGSYAGASPRAVAAGAAQVLRRFV